MGKHRIPLDSVLGGVQVLKKRQAKAFADLITNGQEQETAAVLAELSHRGRNSRGPGEEQVGFSFTLFRIEQADGLARLKRCDGTLDVGLHGLRFGLTFMKSRMLSLSKTTRDG